MSGGGFERLDQTGMSLLDITNDYEGTILQADFGSGYKASAVVGLKCREWSLVVDVLPDSDEHLIDAGAHGPQTRARYLWEFLERRMDAGCEPFWLRDSFTRRDYLVELVDWRITFDVFTSVVFSAGIQLRQRRVSGVESVSAPTDEVNTDGF